jgi:hypothetical protein
MVETLGAASLNWNFRQSARGLQMFTVMETSESVEFRSSEYA